MNKPDDHIPIELRKQLLITQGAMYRSGLKSSKEKVVASLRGETLARIALKQVGLVVLSAWRNRSGLATGIPAALPVVLGGLSKLWKQPKVKPVVRGVAIAGAVASVVALAAKWMMNKSRAAEEGYDSDAGSGESEESNMPDDHSLNDSSMQ